MEEIYNLKNEDDMIKEHIVMSALKIDEKISREFITYG